MFVIRFRRPAAIDGIIFNSLCGPTSIVLPPDMTAIRASSSKQGCSGVTRTSFGQGCPRENEGTFASALNFTPGRIGCVGVALRGNNALQGNVSFIGSPGRGSIIRTGVCLSRVRMCWQPRRAPRGHKKREMLFRF